MSNQPSMQKYYEFLDSERKWRKLWEQTGLYHFDPKSNRPIFSVDTPPPYVSASNLHMGHAMSYIQAEIIVRYRRMNGYNVFYPMGFDDNGLPTERFVEKKYSIDKASVSRQAFIDLCLKETEEGAKNYRWVWECLGIGVDWSLTYNTIGPLAQKISQLSFLDLWEKGLAYRSDAPTFWCPKCGTALAQADLDDAEQKGKMYNITFSSSTGETVTIATTRPEMLPACVSLYIHPNDEHYLHLIQSEFTVPLFGQIVGLRTHEDVDPTKGTGIMMVCTWGDAEDVKKWREDSLRTISLLDKQGRLTEAGGEFAGLKAEHARKLIVKKMTELGLISSIDTVTQIKNVHERCGTPIEFVSSRQWSINVTKFKQSFLKMANELNWHPDFMKLRLEQWIANLKWDWCISRDRYYGVPFPAWHCMDCECIAVASPENLPVDPREHTPPDLRCPQCKSSNLEPELQIMDTWMTSSVAPMINAKWQQADSLMDKIYPMDLRVQAFEIIRTWLFYTLAKAHFHTNSLPWKSVMISGWGLDSKGKKMSKSLGNYVEVATVLRTYSADAVRWWATSSGLGHDLRYVEKDIQIGQKLVTKIWNAARLVEPLIDGKPSTADFKPATFSDAWILAEFQALITECSAHFAVCDFNKARIALEKFFWMKYCDSYLELCKDRIWMPEQYKPEQLASLRSTLTYATFTLLKLFAPILPFCTEEIYHQLFESDESKSIHVSPWPQKNPNFEQPALLERGGILMELLNKIRHFRTEERISVGTSIASLVLVTDDVLLRTAVHDLGRVAKADQSLTANTESSSFDGRSYEIKGNITLILSK